MLNLKLGEKLYPQYRILQFFPEHATPGRRRFFIQILLFHSPHIMIEPPVLNRRGNGQFGVPLREPFSRAARAGIPLLWTVVSPHIYAFESNVLAYGGRGGITVLLGGQTEPVGEYRDAFHFEALIRDLDVGVASF